MIYNCLRKLIYLLTYLIHKFLPTTKPEGFILCYHSISNGNWEFSVTPENFKKQIEFLFKNYQPFSVNDLKKYLEGNLQTSKPFFLITFDDGYKDVYGIKEYIKSKGLHPLMFLISDTNNSDRKELDTSYPLLSVDEIKVLKNEGWDFGSHSATHSDFNTLPSENFEKEVINSKIELEKQLGFEIKYFSYPKGRYNDSIIDYVKKAGYELAFSMDNRILDKNCSKFTIPRVGVMNTHSFIEFMSLPLFLSTKAREIFFRG